MAEFYITEDDKSSNAIHYVHKSTCEKLPEQSTLRYLGSFASGDAAKYKALRTFANIQFCSTCLPRTNSELTQPAASAKKAA